MGDTHTSRVVSTDKVAFLTVAKAFNFGIVPHHLHEVIHHHAVVMDMFGVVINMFVVVMDMSHVVMDMSAVVMDMSHIVMDMSAVVMAMSRVVMAMSRVVMDKSGWVIDMSGKVKSMAWQVGDRPGEVRHHPDRVFDHPGKVIHHHIKVMDRKAIHAPQLASYGRTGEVLPVAFEVLDQKSGMVGEFLLMRVRLRRAENVSPDGQSAWFGERLGLRVVLGANGLNGKGGIAIEVILAADELPAGFNRPVEMAHCISPQTDCQAGATARWLGGRPLEARKNGALAGESCLPR